MVATNFKDDKVNYASFALTRPTSQISVLVECGYLSNPEEEALLVQDEYKALVCGSIFVGLLKFLAN